MATSKKSSRKQSAQDKIIAQVQSQAIEHLIVHDSELEKREARAKSVQVISPNLRYDRGNFHDTILSNVKKGVEYQYIIPDELAVIGAMQSLASELNTAISKTKKSVRVDWRVVPAACVTFDLVIYDVATKKQEAYLVLPEESFSFNLRLNNDFTDRVSGLFAQLWTEGELM